MVDAAFAPAAEAVARPLLIALRWAGARLPLTFFFGAHMSAGPPLQGVP